MNAPDPTAKSGEKTAERVGFGLSTKLLVLTTVFVLVAEVLIFVPSVANFRLNWLRDRIAAAQAAALVIDAAPDGMVPRGVERELLDHVGAMTISLKQGTTRRLLAFSDMPPMVVASFDVRESGWITGIMDTFLTLVAEDGRTIRVIGAHPRQGGFIEIVMDETALRGALLGFARNITLLSLVISAITAALVYLALLWMFVRPMRRIHANMMAFRAAPEDPSRVLEPSMRDDEIGQMEAELQRLQRELQGTLQQKTHLANLGLAVAKINHDLRNILASAQLFSDRLAVVPDPTVQRLVPKVIGALDRAIALCASTLAYGKATEPAPARRRFVLSPLVDEVGTVLGLGTEGRVVWHNSVPGGLEVDADPDQMFRILLNLGRNALEALTAGDGDARRHDAITVSARREGSVVVVEVADTGPGVPDSVRSRLFQPFSGSARAGGTGLGLAIAAELVRGHGGTITLADGTLGATFLLTVPDRPVALAERRVRHAKG